MFQELAALVQASEKVVLTLAMHGEQMSVFVAPVVKNPAHAALATPLALSATPAELDAGFAEAVATVGVAHRSLAEQAEATAAVLKAATSQQSSKATKALAKANAPATQAGAQSDSDPEGDEGEGGAKVTAATAPALAPEPKPAGTDLASLL
ncbi:hypothetical protein BKK79_38135 (plasmid) [Cupriavidus sp. USMAA2-4]|uniref:PRTRC system protein E n=1 Tax=unclassified Cupriavidus TaxID=2640874 RepID=UPI0008A6D86D|nr:MULTISPECIES: PRTRC system protein E [unclassified Cupriavidus]AOY97742.1 hypothetical protein BKK79_38135 [Cupriavidus sp. USMAA2-4]AOZ04222.1 hypothetical protein BKK81_33030 [Cupriavidus sp. USMAHM13]